MIRRGVGRVEPRIKSTCGFQVNLNSARTQGQPRPLQVNLPLLIFYRGIILFSVGFSANICSFTRSPQNYILYNSGIFTQEKQECLGGSHSHEMAGPEVFVISSVLKRNNGEQARRDPCGCLPAPRSSLQCADRVFLRTPSAASGLCPLRLGTVGLGNLRVFLYFMRLLKAGR